MEKELLAFLNGVEEPEQIVERFRVRGKAHISLAMSKRILAARDSLPKQRFRTLAEVRATPRLPPKVVEAALEIVSKQAEKPPRVAHPTPEKKKATRRARKPEPSAAGTRAKQPSSTRPVPKRKIPPKLEPKPEFRPEPTPGPGLQPSPDLVLNDYPILLFPIRLETQFIGNDLWIRMYPDPVSIDTHEPRLTQDEYDAGRNYQQQIAGASSEEDEKRRNAWRELARLFGPERAAWIAKTVNDLGDAEPELRDDEEALLPIPKLRGMPSRFVIYLYRGENLARDPIFGNPISRDLTILAAPSENQEELFDDNSRWMVDLLQAEEDGMAVRVPDLTGADRDEGFSRVIVVGIRASSADTGQKLLEALINNHHYSTGFGFLDYGTPTNNTQTTRSGHSETKEDREGSYDYEIEGHEDENWDTIPEEPRTNAERLGRALGLGMRSEVLRHLTGTDDSADSYAKEIQTALWPVTGDYLLRYLLPGLIDEESNDLTRLAEYFRDSVRPSGPLPTIRVGDQPYGILPVTSVRPKTANHPHGWEAPELDNAEDAEATVFDAPLHQILTGLHGRWLTWATDSERVPRVHTMNDPDRKLLQILAMEPTSTSHRTRPFVEERFVAWLLVALRNYVFGPDTPYAGESVLHWVQKWAETWRDQRDKQAQHWNRLTDAPADKLENAPLLRLLAWWNVKPLELPLVRGTGEGQDPEQYLQDLCGENATTPATLLHDLLKRSLDLADDSPIRKSDVTEAIGQLSSVADREGLLERLLCQTLDLCTHRLDAWITSLATKRLKAMRENRPSGLYVGAYGCVENLRPCDADQQSEGYIHAASAGQAAAAAVLYNAYVTHANGAAPNPFRINLNSERVRRAMHICEGVRQGQPLGALLGYQFERALHEHQLDRYIDEFRDAYPIVANKETEPNPEDAVEEIAARNVVDGLALARWWHGVPEGQHAEAIEKIIETEDSVPIEDLETELSHLFSNLDAVSDLLMCEGVYQAVQGNFERAGAALEAAAGNAVPPQIESVLTPAKGKSLGHRVCILFPPATEDNQGPRAAAEPRLAEWFGDVLGDLSQIVCRYSYQSFEDTVSLRALGINAIDVLYLSASPPSGDETEIEQRVAYYVRKKYGPNHDARVTIDFWRSGDFTYSIGEAIELGRQVLNTLGSASTLRPGSLCLATEADFASFTSDDVGKLALRVTRAHKALLSLITKLRKISLPNRARLIDALFEASRYGVTGAIPPGPDDPDLETRRDAVTAELNKRIAQCEQLKLKAADLDRQAQEVEQQEVPDLNLLISLRASAVETLVDAMKAIFGRGFIVLPEFVPHQAEALVDSFSAGDLLNGLGEERVRLWLQQAAQVHQPLRELEDTLMMTEAWRQPTERAAEPVLRLQVAQLPFTQGDKWLALDDDERGGSFNADIESNRGVLSVVAASAGSPQWLQPGPDGVPPRFSGILIDQWDELIPSDTVDTSIGFQYNAPNTQAPQALLLAVPSQRTKTLKRWESNELAEIVKDTMDLAKIRAVDLDAMREIGSEGPEEAGVGLMLPALMFPTDPEQPGWARDTAFETIEDWLATLTPEPEYELEERVRMYGDIFQEGPVWRTASNIRISARDGSELIPGLFDTNPSDSGTTLLSSSGLRIELPHDVPKITLVAGWLIVSEREIVVRDANNNLVSAQASFSEWESSNPMLNSPQKVVRGNSTLGNYHIYDCEIVSSGIRSVEILGRSLINRIETYRIV